MGKILCGSEKMEGGNKKKNQDDEINDIDQEPKPKPQRKSNIESLRTIPLKTTFYILSPKGQNGT